MLQEPINLYIQFILIVQWIEHIICVNRISIISIINIYQKLNEILKLLSFYIIYFSIYIIFYFDNYCPKYIKSQKKEKNILKTKWFEWWFTHMSASKALHILNNSNLFFISNIFLIFLCNREFCNRLSDALKQSEWLDTANWLEY